MDDNKAGQWLKNFPGSVSRWDKKIRRLNHDLASVHETTRLLTGPMDLQHVLEIVVKTVTQALGADAAGLRLLDEENDTLVLEATYGLSEHYKTKGPVTAGESVLNRRALAGEAIVVNDMRKDVHFKRYHDDILREGLVSNLSIGLLYREKGIGIMRIYSKRPRRFSKADISLAQTIAAQSAAAIVNARLYREALEGERMSRQIRLAGTVQRHLIPEKSPVLPGYDLAGRYAPCYDVGGDLYDYILLPNDQFVVTIGDVMGKGVPASLAMASVRSSLRAYSQHIEGVDELVAGVNRMFTDDTVPGEFATLFCAKIHLPSGQMSYCNCGHNPPILMKQGEPQLLLEGGTVIGLDSHSHYQAQHVQLESGDIIVMYTDGLEEAVNFNNEQFGRQRIIEAIQASADMSADAMSRNILWLMRKFAGLTRRSDDTAIVVLKKL